ncbi:MAG: restriction endonuclease [Clostridia bacterium]|nr:restriction endonuclease [Clostridia bacterium]
MARKKKEEINQELTAETAAQTVAEPAPVKKLNSTKKKTSEKENAVESKTVKRAKTVKKTALKGKTDKQLEEGKNQENPVLNAEEKQSEKEQDNQEKQTKKQENSESKTVKEKRGRKPVAKKTEEKSTEKTGAETLVLEEKKKTQETAVQPKKSEKKTVTRAEKNETIKSLIKELLLKRPYKWNELLDESAKLYEEKIEEKDGHVANDVRGRVGSVVDVMKKDGEIVFDGGMYALKQPLEKKADEKPVEISEKTQTEQEEKREKQLPAIKEKAEIAPVFDMSLLLGQKTKSLTQEKKEKTEELTKAEVAQTQREREEKSENKTQKKPAQKSAVKTQAKTQEKSVNKKETAEKKQEKRVAEKRTARVQGNKLKEEFLKKIRSLSGRYFEYYSIYLLERYSLKNGRRVDGFKVSGGENDGGIDGEIEVTDRIGFKETIYIQAKNWNPVYGKEDSWIIGETALREFIGAVAYRQAKEGKQHCRGIFITTSYFTAGSKEILEKMSDRFVGYDGDDLFEAAKECSFGLIEKNGVWELDEKLFAGEKAFFNL